MSAAPDIAARFRRAKKDPLGRLLADLGAAGARFRISGADLVVDGAARLEPDALALLRANLAAIRERLAPPVAATSTCSTSSASSSSSSPPRSAPAR